MFGFLPKKTSEQALAKMKRPSLVEEHSRLSLTVL